LTRLGVSAGTVVDRQCARETVVGVGGEAVC